MIGYVEVWLHTISGPVILPNYRTITFDTKYNEIGAIEFEYPLTEADQLGLKDQSLVSVRVGLPNGSVAEVERYIIENTSDEKVSDGVRIKTLSGRSRLALLEDAVVYPSNWPVTTPTGHEFVDMTLGNIFRTLILRAKDRGGLADLDETTFTGTADSNGAVWSHSHTQNYTTGTSYLSILLEFMERGFADAWVDSTGKLRILNGGTRGQHIALEAVEFKAASNVTEMITSTQSGESATTVLIEGEEGTAVERHSADFQNVIGRRRERYVQQGGIADSGILTLLGDAELELFGRIPTEESIGIASNVTPFLDFNVADWVWVRYDSTSAPVERRVRQLAVAVNENREIELGVTLNSILYESDVALARRVQAYTGSGGSYGSVPNAGIDNTVPSPPSSLGVVSGAYVTQGRVEAAMTVTWSPPQTNVGGSAISDLDHFEVQWKYDTDVDWSGVYPTSNSSLQYSPMVPGKGIDVRVRAVDQSGHASDWTTKTDHVLAADATPPPKPATPTAMSRLGSVHVTWSGTTSTGAAQPTDFSYAEIHGSQSGGFIPAKGDPATLKATVTGADIVVFTNLPYNQTWYYRVIAVDSSGNASTPSDVSTGVVVQALVDTDLIGEVIDGVHIIDGTIGSGQLSTDVNQSIVSANGKSKITHSLNAPTSSDLNKPGDTWFRYNASNQVIGQWRGNGDGAGAEGGLWVPQTIESQVIASLDVAKLTGQFIDASHINTRELLVGPSLTLGEELDSAWLNQNSTFADWNFPSPPVGWGVWGVNSPLQETTLTRSGGKAVRWTSTGTSNQGLSDSTALDGYLPLGTDYVVVEIDVMLLAGNFTGAGVLLDWTGMSPTARAVLPLKDAIPNPSLNMWYRVTKTLKNPGTSGTHTSWASYIMANYASAEMGALTDKTIIFDRVGFRPATSAEISAYNSTTAAYVQSRGVNLITNGTGLLGNSTNFPGATFDKVDTPTGAVGAFRYPTGQGVRLLDEIIPVDPSKIYEINFDAKQIAGAGRCYSFFSPLDAYGNGIAPAHYMAQTGTLTTLAAALNPGDTTISLTSAANWNNTSAQTYHRSIIVWNYVDPGGKVWPENTYSRNYWSDLWAVGGISGNTITLKTPWAGPAIPAGTKLSNGSSGGSYMYIGASNSLLDNTWQHFSGRTSKGALPGGAGGAVTNFPMATASARIGFLVNYPASGSADPTSVQSFANVTVTEVTAASDAREGAVLDLKTLWGHPQDTTLIDGGDIYTNSIKAYSIAIADFTNYIYDPYMKNTGGWAVVGNAAWSFVTVLSANKTPGGHLTVARATTTSTGTFDSYLNNSPRFPVAAGEEYLVTSQVRKWSGAATAGFLYAGLWFYDDAGTYVSSSYESLTASTLTTSWNTMKKSVIVPSGATKAAVLLYLYNVTGAVVVDWGDAYCLRKNKGELIVDGTITGVHLQTLSISTGHLMANAVTTPKVAAGSITADRLSITARGTSVLANSWMEDTWTNPDGTTLSRPAQWDAIYANGGSPTYSFSPTPIAGTKSLRVTTPADVDWTIGNKGGFFPVTAGEEWYVRADFRPAASVPSGKNLLLRLHTSKPGKEPWGLLDPDVSWQSVSLPGPLTAGAIYTVEKTFVVPAGHVQGAVSIGADAQTAAWTLDVDTVECYPAVSDSNITEVGAGKITTGLIRANQKIVAGASFTGARTEMTDTGFWAYNTGGAQTFNVNAANGTTYVGDPTGAHLRATVDPNPFQSGTPWAMFQIYPSGPETGLYPGQIWGWRDGGQVRLRISSPFFSNSSYSSWIDMYSDNIGGSSMSIYSKHLISTANTFTFGSGDQSQVDFNLPYGNNMYEFKNSGGSRINLRFGDSLVFNTVESRTGSGTTTLHGLKLKSGGGHGIHFDTTDARMITVTPWAGGTSPWIGCNDQGTDAGWEVYGGSPGRLRAVGAVGGWRQVDAEAFNPQSDVRLKTNFTEITDALDVVRQVKAYDYDRIHGFVKNGEVVHFDSPTPPERHRGVIAQDLNEVLPNAVVKSDPDNIGVNLYDLVATLWAGLRESDAQTQELKSQIEDLTRQVEDLKPNKGKK